MDITPKTAGSSTTSVPAVCRGEMIPNHDECHKPKTEFLAEHTIDRVPSGTS